MERNNPLSSPLDKCGSGTKHSEHPEVVGQLQIHPSRLQASVRGEWVQSQTGAEELMGKAACGEKAVILWRWGRFPQITRKEDRCRWEVTI